jgi:endo-1,4-beta-xylanase
MGAIGTAALLTASAVSADAGAPPYANSLRSLAAHVNLRIGTAVNPYDLDHASYRRITANQFSAVTPENEMKWEVVEPTRGRYDWSGGDRLVRFATGHQQLVRGHTLLWHSQLPAWLVNGVDDGSISNAELRNLLHNHIVDEVTHFRGEIWQWDVANEFFADAGNPDTLPNGMNGADFWVSHLGTGIVAAAFRWAHQADPTALLFYNDFNIAGEDGTNAKFQAVYNWVKQQRAAGVPINGIGDQGHLDLQYGGSPTKMRRDLRAYAGLGLKVAITEADVRTFVNNATEQQPTDPIAPFAQADAYSGMLQACLAVKACLDFTVWGFGDLQSWVPATFPGEGYADIYDVDLNPKRSFFALRNDLRLAAGQAPVRPVTT